MIKVVFTYQTPTRDLPELMQKLQDSTAQEFNSDPAPTQIHLFKREFAETTEIVLDIYYASHEDYHARTAFEKNNAKWQSIWFNAHNKHREVSVVVYHLL